MGRENCDTARLDEDLRAAIAELLDLEIAEINSNSDSTFIELGGNSVKALELTFKLDAVGKGLDIETVLAEESSIQRLSQALQENTTDDSGSGTASNDDTTPTVQTPDTKASDNYASGSQNPSKLSKEVSRRLKCRETDVEHVLPLTSQQRGLWLGSLQAPGAYVSHWQFDIAEGIDVDRLLHAWQRVVEVNEILRSRIVALSDSQLHQVVLTEEYHPGNINLVSSTTVTAEEGKPLFGVHVETQLGSRILDVRCHHVLYDRWSMKLILQDVQTAYDRDSFPDPRPSYTPFLDCLNEMEIEQQVELWRSAIQGEFPTSVPVVNVSKDFPLASECIELTASIGSLKSATPAQIISAAWSFVTSRHSGSNRVSFGLTVWGRDIPLPGVTKMTFPTFNTMPFVSTTIDEGSVQDLLEATKSHLSLLRRTQRLDVEAISSINSACRDACRFNSVLVIQQDKATVEETGLFGSRNLLSFDATQSSPLVLECTPNGKQLTLKMKYDPSYIPSIEAEAMLHHLKSAIEVFSSASDQCLNEVNLMSEYDLKAIRNWVVPSIALRKTTLHSLVQDAAHTWPDSTAMWSTESSITYREMMSHARNVMEKVVSSNPKTSPNIGVCFEKSPYAVIAQLGISMSGYTYVPMDASNPFNRLMQLVNNAQMELVVCSRSVASKFEQESIKTLIVDDETLNEASDCEDETPISSDPGSNVYIIYTSGSTGEPKGVIMTQQALCTTLEAIADHLEFSPETRDLQFSSFAFDMSVHDIWCTFLKGGTVCMPTEAERFDLEDFIERSGSNYAMFTPSVALTLSDNSWKKFKKFSTSGEPLPKAVFRNALQAGVKFWNTYGPTESCVICITNLIDSMDSKPSRLGYSMAATSWIIDADNPHRLAPIGCVGELALTGHTLARGYYRDPEKTDKAFMPGLDWTKDFPEFPLDKVYRTGDLAKYNSDGSIEFGGRLGGYIKIAGNRVDPGEIEFVLHSKCDLPKVSVQYCRIGSGEVRDLLVSFCVDPSKSKGEQSELLALTDDMRARAARGLRRLRELLPRYMIPVVFFPISRFPYNTAGKLDKKCLINLVADRDVEGVLADYGIDTQTNEDSIQVTENQSLSPEAEILREAWKTVLKINQEKISGRSNFFELGGDSLRAMNLGATLREVGYSISVADIFRCPSLIEMAGKLSHLSTADVEKSTEEIWDTDETERLELAASKTLGLAKQHIESLVPCTSLQMQMLAASAQSSTYIHRECFAVGSEITTEEIHSICRILSSRNELLRSKAFIDEKTGTFVLAILNSSVPVVPLKQEEASLQQYVSTLTEPMGLERELTRFVLLECDGTRTLVWETHHSIFDGYSNILLINQFHDIVLQIREEKERVAEEPAITSFKNFVHYTLRTDQKEAEIFWSKYLRGSPKLDLAFANPSSTSRATNAKASRRLEYVDSQSEFTTAVHIRAAFAIVLSQYTCSHDVVFSATNHGRDLPVKNIDKLVGPTFSTLPIRCVIDRNESLEDFMSRIQLEAAEISTYQYLSTEAISSIDADCKQACHFDVHLLVQTAASESLFDTLNDLGYSSLADPSPMSLQIPFNLVATAKDHTINFDLIYNDEMFPNEQVDLFFDQFLCILDQVLTTEKTEAVHTIRDLGEMNRNACLSVQPVLAHVERFANLTIPELVFEDLDSRKDDQALFSTKTSFTYQEMYDTVLALAEDIVEAVGGSRRYIAVAYEKSPWAIMAQLAVMMAGHAYVPVDTSWPDERMHTVLKQLTSPLLITSSQRSELLQDLSIQLRIFDATRSVSQEKLGGSVMRKATPTDAAYVIFTSGSTGTPKGVVVQHDAICRTLSTYAERLNIKRTTRAILFASFSFDASVMETWSVLAAGGTLCIANEEERIAGMDAFLKQSRADCVGLTPTGAMLLDPTEQGNLKTLLFCGEKTKAKDIDRWTGAPNLRLVNAYGPSETSVNAVMNTNFSKDDLSNIGYTMGGGLWLVDPEDSSRFVPVGGIGELLVTGPVLAKEYLNDPEKTAEKFVYPQWPEWSKMRGQRAYRTGDLVRLDCQGDLHFVGRFDGQMKINGIRIEAGEVENAAQQSNMTGLEEVVVSAHASSEVEGSQELILFFIPSGQTQTERSTSILPLGKNHQQLIKRLNEHLQTVLARTHVPSLYVPVTTIPLGTTGKVDKKRLLQELDELHPAQVDLFRPVPEDRNAKPSGPVDIVGQDDLSHTETTLASLWSQVLHLVESGTITRTSHFVQVGGDSVAAIRLSSVAKSKGLDLPVQVIYSNPVLRDMAAAIDLKPDTGPKIEDIVTPSPFELLDEDALSPLMTGNSSNRVKSHGDYFGSR